MNLFSRGKILKFWGKFGEKSVTFWPKKPRILHKMCKILHKMCKMCKLCTFRYIFRANWRRGGVLSVAKNVQKWPFFGHFWSPEKFLIFSSVHLRPPKKHEICELGEFRKKMTKFCAHFSHIVKNANLWIVASDLVFGTFTPAFPAHKMYKICKICKFLKNSAKSRPDLGRNFPLKKDKFPQLFFADLEKKSKKNHFFRLFWDFLQILAKNRGCRAAKRRTYLSQKVPKNPRAQKFSKNFGICKFFATFAQFVHTENRGEISQGFYWQNVQKMGSVWTEFPPRKTQVAKKILEFGAIGKIFVCRIFDEKSWGFLAKKTIKSLGKNPRFLVISGEKLFAHFLQIFSKISKIFKIFKIFQKSPKIWPKIVRKNPRKIRGFPYGGEVSFC